MATVTRLVTAEDMEQLPSDVRCELIDGVLVELPVPGAEHGGVQAELAGLLRDQVRPNRLGRVMVEVGFILRRDPDTVRLPDLAFVRAERIPAEGLPRGFWEIAPDLAVEVVSPGDTPVEVQAKVREWIEAGCRQVWLVYPVTRTIVVVRSLRERQELGVEDVLEGGDVIPGFSCRVADIFE